MKDLYAILEISRSASPEVIRAAYRALAKRYHPDNKESGNPGMFRAVKEAHDILLDEAQRAVYDAQTQNGHQQQQNYPPSPPRQRQVYRNGVGWVWVDDPAPYPGDFVPPSQYGGPTPYGPPSEWFYNPRMAEEMMRNAASGVFDRLVEEVINKMRGRR